MSDHKPCPDCSGRGFNYSDPDRKLLACGMCNGDGELEDKMSEKYSTEEMIAYLDDPAFGITSGSMDSAIIARLRAADKLCEAAKHPNFNNGVIFCESDSGLKKLRKAIADYEGEK